MSKLKKALLYTTSIEDKSGWIHEQLAGDNRKLSVIWSILLGGYWLVYLIVSFVLVDYAACRIPCLVALGADLVALLFAATVARKAPKLIYPVVYLIKATLLGVGIACALCLPDTKTVTFVAAAILAPMLFADNTLPSILLAVGCVVAYAVAGYLLSPIEIYKWMIFNLILYSVVGISFGHFINKTRFERYVNTESTVKLAELQTRYAYYDQMTGLKNRRSYSETIEQFSKDAPDYCCVVMVDVNGLKEANDLLGHDAGDELIVGTAECLRQGFKKTDDVYRLGGDEFCVITTDEKTDVNECLPYVTQACAAWSGAYINGISVSYGYASTKEFSDLKTLLKTADERMCEYKSAYYESIGKKRR